MDPYQAVQQFLKVLGRIVDYAQELPLLDYGGDAHPVIVKAENLCHLAAHRFAELLPLAAGNRPVHLPAAISNHGELRACIIAAHQPCRDVIAGVYRKLQLHAPLSGTPAYKVLCRPARVLAEKRISYRVNDRRLARAVVSNKYCDPVGKFKLGVSVRDKILNMEVLYYAGLSLPDLYASQTRSSADFASPSAAGGRISDTANLSSSSDPRTSVESLRSSASRSAGIES